MDKKDFLQELKQRIDTIQRRYLIQCKQDKVNPEISCSFTDNSESPRLELKLSDGSVNTIAAKKLLLLSNVYIQVSILNYSNSINNGFKIAAIEFEKKFGLGSSKLILATHLDQYTTVGSVLFKPSKPSSYQLLEKNNLFKLLYSQFDEKLLSLSLETLELSSILLDLNNLHTITHNKIRKLTHLVNQNNTEAILIINTFCDLHFEKAKDEIISVIDLLTQNKSKQRFDIKDFINLIKPNGRDYQKLTGIYANIGLENLRQLKQLAKVNYYAKEKLFTYFTDITTKLKENSDIKSQVIVSDLNQAMYDMESTTVRQICP